MNFRSIVVTGNCYAVSVADAVGAFFPDTEVKSFPAWEMETTEGRKIVAEALAAADAWVSMPLEANADLQRELPADTTRVNIPTITFLAFHPDLVYATHADGSILRGLSDYHSAIGLWAWRRGLEPAEAAGLFTPATMATLNYDNYWRVSVEMLRDDFGKSDLEFGPFWSRLKRCGVFMHSINHPRPEAISLLSKSIAVRLGAPESVWDLPLERYLQDYLAHVVWPVYPFVAGALGVPGCYRWRVADRQFPDVRSWLEATWSAYEGTSSEGVRCPRIDDGVYDTVLEARVNELAGVRS